MTTAAAPFGRSVLSPRRAIVLPMVAQTVGAQATVQTRYTQLTATAVANPATPTPTKAPNKTAVVKGTGATPLNVREDRHWTDSFSHGELLRAGAREASVTSCSPWGRTAIHPFTGSALTSTTPLSTGRLLSFR